LTNITVLKSIGIFSLKRRTIGGKKSRDSEVQIFPFEKVRCLQSSKTIRTEIVIKYQ